MSELIVTRARGRRSSRQIWDSGRRHNANFTLLLDKLFVVFIE